MGRGGFPNGRLTWDDGGVRPSKLKTGRAGVSAPVLPALGTAPSDETGRTTPVTSILPEGSDSKKEHPGEWIREEFRRAAERVAALPPYARPVVTRPFFVQRGDA